MADQESALGEEVGRLFGAVQEWARQTFPAPTNGPGPDCEWCPICQFMAVLRGERPELTDRVAQAGAAFGSAVRTLLDAAAAGVPHRHSEPDDESRVQHIDLDDPDL